jgi:hypothetical protein
MRWISLVLAGFFCIGCCVFDGCNDDDTPPPGQLPPGDSTPAPTPSGTPSTPQVIETQYVRLSPEQLREFTWTSTGAGTITASISWPSAATLSLYLDKGGIVAQQTGASPLQVSAHAGGAGEVWTIGMQNNSATSATVSYTLTFLPD